MTREEAIDCLEGLKIYLKTEHIDQEAVGMAIESLQKDIERHEAVIRASEGNLDIVRCKECKHRHGVNCPMYYEEWFTIDEGDGYYDSDFRIIDGTQDDGFCDCGEKEEDK